ncbi:ankyrin repeat domain-containing protein [Helicobacter japonicus]|uniref:ankyrin repeat domain-containing protein n=1 Tax=Helicobacter japonicus TaxID=425400 RepID=UPI0026F3D21A|nr:ankyrin repeat domain-containing protein [Helicobacter japonicus]
MKTKQEIKAMNRKQRNALVDELYALIETNDTEKVKGFLQEYPLQESFYEENIKDGTYKLFLFQVEYVLAEAAVAYEKYKDPAMIEFLQEWGLRIDYHHNGYGRNALTSYIEKGGEDEMVIKYLLDKGLTCEKRGDDGDGWTPMHWWARRNNYKALKIAITKAGANVDVLDGLGKTPLFHSVEESSNYKATQILIELGANVNYATPATPLDDAQGAKNKKLLKDAGAMTKNQIKKKFKIDLWVNREDSEEEQSRTVREIARRMNDALKKAKG